MGRLFQPLFAMAVGLLIVVAGRAAGAAVAESAPPAVSPADQGHLVYLPLVSKAPNACVPIPGVSYLALSVVDRYDPAKPPPENNPDYRLTLLGYNPVDQHKGLVIYNPPGSEVPPQFTTLLEGSWTPVILNTYQANGWDWDHHQPIPTPWTWPPVSVIGVPATPTAIIRVPDSGYTIGHECGNGGCDALVIYASRQEITLKYTRDDRVSYPPPGNAGYTVHIAGLCVEPSLLTLYQQKHTEGRFYLPAVRGGQPIGRAWGHEIVVAIRDNGPFLDPRDCHAFWQGRCP
ncbi:MAG: hypothetical protein RML46_02280 [Anaerolineae bacterium]|nr:hypothetical protein [Anaerolineae bacterium]MDW8067724.1 hypothetical protein [Anaerolineae bacterium]